MTQKSAFTIRLERGENVFSMLTDFCARKNIEAAVFTALGALEKTKIGYYDLSKKEYGSVIYAEAREVASMTGNVALVEGTPFLHIHAVLSGIAPGTENQCVGGHVFAATVAVTLEVHMSVFNEPISRAFDEEIGLKLLDCTSFD